MVGRHPDIGDGRDIIIGFVIGSRPAFRVAPTQQIVLTLFRA